MTQQAMPNPVELYQAASRRTQQIIAGVKPGQLKDSTPCSEWNVQALIDHLVGGAAMFAGVLSGQQPQQPPASSSPAAAFEANAARVLEVSRKPGTLEIGVQSPVGEMPGGQFLFVAFMDTTVHGWDLAKATGQDTKMNPQHVEVIYHAFSPMMDMLRASGNFGPEVRVPANASTQDKLLGMMGRKL